MVYVDLHLAITSTLALSTSIPNIEILCPRTMPSFTVKWHFSQFRTKLVSLHRLSILSKWERHEEKESPKIEKLSMKTSIVSSIMSWKMAIMHLWNMPGALHKPKGIRRHTMNGAHPRAIGDRVNQSGIKEFDNFLFDNLMNFWVHSSLR
ncbi:hypothetical protein Tco_1290889 [Tanacetum coccineum]